jgi:hypothetical protein
MTIINDIEIDNIRFQRNPIHDAMKNNSPIEEKLHVISIISNPCLYAKRYVLMKEFIKRFEMNEEHAILYIVELAYDNQKFIITDKKNPNHLQIRVKTPLWHKENMINLGVKKLLPTNWKAFAWIDSDLEFDSPTWAIDTLKILNGAKDIVQIFSHCVDLDHNDMTMSVFNSAGYQYSYGKTYCNTGPNYWHPGFAWAITRKAYDSIGGLYDSAILGSGDNIMLLSLLGNGLKAINEKSTDGYKESIRVFQKKARHLRFGYTPGMIRHYFHGSKKNRKYTERWKILLDHEYCPNKHITYDKNGIIIPTNSFSDTFKAEIMDYFAQRNEDELFNGRVE